MVINMKKTLAFFLILTLMIGACGCNMKNQDKINRMLLYMNTKYSEDAFDFKCMDGGNLGSNETKILVTSRNYPQKWIRVTCTTLNGEEIYTDTYLNVKYEEQTREYIEEKLVGLFGENIYLTFEAGDVASKNNDSSEATFAQYLKSEDTYIFFEALVCGDSSDPDAALEKVKTAFSDAVLRGMIYYVDADVKLTGEDGVNTAKQILRQQTYAKRLFFIKTSLETYSKADWTDGK